MRRRRTAPPGGDVTHDLRLFALSEADEVGPEGNSTSCRYDADAPGGGSATRPRPNAASRSADPTVVQERRARS